MKFNSQNDAYDHWEQTYYFHGGFNRSDSDRWAMFADWVEDRGITWLDEEDRKFIEEFEL